MDYCNEVMQLAIGRAFVTRSNVQHPGSQFMALETHWRIICEEDEQSHQKTAEQIDSMRWADQV